MTVGDDRRGGTRTRRRSLVSAERPFTAIGADTPPPPIKLNTHKPTHLYILILQRLHIEPNRRNRLDGLVGLVLETVQDGGLSGIVQAEDQYSDLLGPEETLEESAH